MKKSFGSRRPKTTRINRDGVEPNELYISIQPIRPQHTVTKEPIKKHYTNIKPIKQKRQFTNAPINDKPQLQNTNKNNTQREKLKSSSKKHHIDYTPQILISPPEKKSNQKKPKTLLSSANTRSHSGDRYLSGGNQSAYSSATTGLNIDADCEISVDLTSVSENTSTTILVSDNNTYSTEHAKESLSTITGNHSSRQNSLGESLPSIELSNLEIYKTKQDDLGESLYPVVTLNSNPEVCNMTEGDGDTRGASLSSLGDTAYTKPTEQAWSDVNNEVCISNEDNTEFNSNEDNAAINIIPSQPSSPVLLKVEDIESDSDDYDTDIEDNFAEKRPELVDDTGTKDYCKQCSKQQIVPSTRFIKQLSGEKLRYRYRGMSGDSSSAISKGLLNNYSVEQLDLSNNNMGNTAGLNIINILREKNMLTDLDLSENNLGAEVGCQLAEILMTNTILLKLFLKGNKFTDRVAKSFAETLKKNTTLKHLDFSYNDVNERGALFFGAGLAMNKGVEVMNLRWNCIRAKGGVSIGAALGKNSTLKELDISWNGLTFIGCLAIGRHLKKNQTLEVLDLRNNRIGADAPAKLTASISQHPSLRVLRMGLNPIGDAGVQVIVKAAEKSSSLKYVGFEKITITRSTQRLIDKVQESNDIIIETGGIGGLARGKPLPGSMDTLVQFIKDNRMRLTDLFFCWDKDRNGRITNEEFVKGLMQTGLKMNMAQIENLINQLDANDDGNIEFSEILAGQQIVMSERRFQKKIEIQTVKRDKASIRLPKLTGF